VVATVTSNYYDSDYFESDVIAQVTEGGGGSEGNSSRTISDAERRYHIIRQVVNGYAVPAVCFFGIIGNLFNLIVLTRKRLQRR